MLKLLASGVCAMLLSGIAAYAGHDQLVCGDCHVIHQPDDGTNSNATTQKWSTKHTADGLSSFTLFSSPTFDALRTNIGQPDGSSKLCLGCHDGSYAGVEGTSAFDPGDLARSHPISFTYNSALAMRVRSHRLNDPASTSSGLGGTIAQDLLDENSKMQCTSCHDMHAPNTNKSYLRYSSSKGETELCRVCHNM